MRLSLVEWEDSSTCVGWHRLGYDDDISRCVSIGVLCKESDKFITLALSKSDSGNIGDTISIPRSCVKRIRRLKIA